MFRLSPLPTADVFTLAGPEGRHAATVRRLRPGESVDVTDGYGAGLECAVVAVRRDEIDCAVRRRVDAAAPRPRLVVVQALAKGDRGERAVEMLTEVGVDEIVPWSAARSVVRWEGERGARARERWVRAAAEASKQSHRLHWPVVGALVGAAELTRRVASGALAVVLHEQAGDPLAGLARLDATALDATALDATALDATAAAQTGPAAEILLVVGPEGGIADAEVEALRQAGAAVARLGPTVLRTSTAGVVASSVVLADLGRWDARCDDG
ncbi:16S rRNA (uracil(1498)-N(3))-methyltransferase [Candidatus Frankia alpina]|uniref:Ribosomal RNA small subunit methyltransferase E n=1 Tax=Candidatus Frankia alpina TaxID=2699483 RepID=A0A4S5EU06_9ACTN|nr:16S rRNA (uracil(1498)-N(3))-methyltransferase [Candidatus Frankia alpina]THJ75956.1 16S rRNA (uracil(1498)-N(3))-methyltransferase [Candidatus Frankia alpina]